MKKNILLFFLLLTSYSFSQTTYIPDDNFENYLETHNASGAIVPLGDAASMGNGIANDNYVYTSRIENVTLLLLSFLGIQDFTGIENFTALENFYCSNNAATSLDLTNNLNLKILQCSDAGLTNLNLNGLIALEEVQAARNNLTTVDVSTNIALTDLTLSTNNLSSLNVSANTLLEDLQVHETTLTSIDLSTNVNLTRIIISLNQLTELDLTNNPLIDYLNCGRNPITNLNVNHLTNLDRLIVDKTAITSLDLSNNSNLRILSANDLPNFEYLNLKNGNNGIINDFEVVNNPNLTCIEVDDPTATYLTTWVKDATASFALDCRLTNVPDDNFENYLETHNASGAIVPLGDATSMGNGIANDNYVYTSRIENVTLLLLSFLGVQDFTGIEDFTALENFYCSNNAATSLDLTNNLNLKILQCSDAGLTNLNINGLIALEEVQAARNNLTTVDVSTNIALTDLTLSTNNLSSLNVSANTLLEDLQVHETTLTSIDLSTNVNLTRIIISLNQLTELDLTNNPLIDYLNCGRNPITNLNVNHLTNLDRLIVDETAITSLDLSNNSNLRILSANDLPNFEYLNLKNENNGIINDFEVVNNPNLTCIEVDDSTATYLTTWVKDATASFAQYCRFTYVPDDNFENYLETHNINTGVVPIGNSASLGNGIMDDMVPTEKIESVTFLNIPNQNIADLTGIEDFSGLTRLWLQNNLLTTLDVSQNLVLEELFATNMPLNSINLTGVTTLEELNVANSNLTTIDLSTNINLAYLNVESNNLMTLNINNQNLTSLTFSDNAIAVIDLSNQTNLSSLWCENTSISALNFQNNTLLEVLKCGNTSLNTLDVSMLTVLLDLSFENTNVSTIDLSNNVNLRDVTCDETPLMALDLSTLIALDDFSCKNSQLENLNLQNGFNTNINTVDITGNPNLTCVLVDNQTYANTYWTNKDTQTVYSETSCDQSMECPVDITQDADSMECLTEVEVTTPTVYATVETVGQALNFDGSNDRITVANGFANDLSEVTIEVKVNFETISNWDTLLNYAGWSTGYLHFQLNSGGQLGWSINGNSPTDQYISLGLQTNTWYNLAVTYSATDKKTRFYLNGVLQSERTYSTAIPLIANKAFSIGAWSSRMLDGSIDDFRIWNTVRTQTEIQSALDIPLSGNEAGLIAYYNFNEGDACVDNSSITTITDQVNGTYNATLHNFNLTDIATNCSSNFVNGTIQDYLLVNDYNNSTLLTEDFPAGTTNVTWTLTNNENQVSTCNQVITVNNFNSACYEVALSPKVFLQGALLNPNTGEENWMRDDLRNAALIPTTSPYDMSEVNGVLFMLAGQDAIVDWVQIELRDATDNTMVIAEKSALLQRDGDIVDLDGVSPVVISVSHKNYYIVIKHSNHLGIMSANTVALTDVTTSVDFTNGNNQITYGSNAQTTFGMPTDVVAMWCGNANADTVVQYSGTTPDTPAILSEILNDPGNFLNFPTFAVSGYNVNDVNMNGNTQYSGTNPDVPFILQNVLAHPGNFLNFSTYQIIEQLPEN